MQRATFLGRGLDRGGRVVHRGVQLAGALVDRAERFLESFACGIEFELSQALLDFSFTLRVGLFSQLLPPNALCAANSSSWTSRRSARSLSAATVRCQVRAELLGDSLWSEEHDDKSRTERIRKRRYTMRQALKKLVPELEGTRSPPSIRRIRCTG